MQAGDPAPPAGAEVVDPHAATVIDTTARPGAEKSRARVRIGGAAEDASAEAEEEAAADEEAADAPRAKRRG